MIRCFTLLLAAMSIVTGCGQIDNSNSEKVSTPPVAKQITERMTGKTAVKTYKNTKDVLGDVEKVRDKRASELNDFKKD